MKKKIIIIVCSLLLVGLIIFAILYFTRDTSDKKKSLYLGEIVNIDNQEFYFIKEDKKNNKVVLVTKYNIDNIKLTQVSKDLKLSNTSFSKTNYWSSSKYPGDVDINYKESSVLEKANRYAKHIDVKASGRLLTKKEFDEMNEFINHDYKDNYWLMTASSEDKMYVYISGTLREEKYNTKYLIGIRPVIEIDKSFIEKE